VYKEKRNIFSPCMLSDIELLFEEAIFYLYEGE
jgi:hypothetical protein